MEFTLTKEKREELRREWVSDLRSGKFKQATGALEENGGNCCLGVLCRTLDRLHPGVLRIDTFSNGPTVFEEKFDAVLPPLVQRAAGLSSDAGDFGDENSSGEISLAKHNDDGKTFAEIADIIESRPAGLFVDEESTVQA